ncbi:hypothetical protein [Dethiobacter alkaliphilus]|uniref:hypothetical protein n=1 Tax=Dethiobacter alkaliphilus TaxID=427926 RepID=UPI00222778D1|nr:hypothetical protein [Dethiobacter alkaliphilus]MCW3491190.1 hypothetical protein [Dethiobacter alkaliphilus]
MYQSDVYQLNSLLKQMRQECRELQEEITEGIDLLQEKERIRQGKAAIVNQLNEDIKDAAASQKGYWEPYKKEKMERRLERFAAMLPA